MVSPALQRGGSVPNRTEPESPRDGAFFQRKLEKHKTGGDSRKCQTPTIAPAEPGVSPFAQNGAENSATFSTREIFLNFARLTGFMPNRKQAACAEPSDHRFQRRLGPHQGSGIALKQCFLAESVSQNRCIARSPVAALVALQPFE